MIFQIRNLLKRERDRVEGQKEVKKRKDAVKKLCDSECLKYFSAAVFIRFKTFRVFIIISNRLRV